MGEKATRLRTNVPVKVMCEGRIVTRDEARELYHFAYVPKPNEIGDSFTNYPTPPASHLHWNQIPLMTYLYQAIC